MSVVEIEALIACDECGKQFRSRMDPASRGPAGWSLWDYAEDAVRGGYVVGKPGDTLLDKIRRSSSVQDGKMLCPDCTTDADMRCEEAPNGRHDFADNEACSHCGEPI